MILVDSSVWIDFFRGVATDQVGRLLPLLDGEDLLIGDLVLCEILQGVRSDREATQIERTLQGFTHVTLGGPELAITAARNYRFLRGHGITVRTTIDLIIGTFCIERSHSLLHSDRDFEPMERLLGLRTV